MRSLKKIAVVCVLIAAAVYGCKELFFPTYHVRFRLTLEVKDGDQIRTGASVLEVEYQIYPEGVNDGPSSFRRVVGYAPTVDLGAKGLLFLTFQDALRTPDQMGERTKRILCLLDDLPCLPFAAYAKPGSPFINSTFSQQKIALDELLRQSGPRDVPFISLPQLVTFADINDSRTKRVVPPFDLAASFGQGAALSRVVLELTTSPITPEPQIWPQWLKVRGQNVEFRG